MEECALGHACRLADVVHRGCRVALGADDIHGRVQQFCFRTFPERHNAEHTNRLVITSSGLPANAAAAAHECSGLREDEMYG
jgi:hypothetical protein